MTLIARRLLAAAALLLPLLPAPALAAPPMREYRCAKIKRSNRPKLSRVLSKIERSMSLVDNQVMRKKLTAEEARKLFKDLAAIRDKTFAMAKKGRDLPDDGMRSLNWEVEEIGRRIRS